MRLSPIKVGTEAPPLSLTADEGTWVKLRDFRGQMAVILLFFKSEDESSVAWLKAWSAANESAGAVDAVVFGVHTAATDRLRDLRAHLRGEFFFLYDPLALTARAFGMSSRVLPQCKDGVVVVDQDQQVIFSERGLHGPDEILPLVAQSTGKALPGQEAAAGPQTASKARVPGQAQKAVEDIDGDRAEQMLAESDSPYILVDVRTKSEFDADHSVHAIHVPVDELPHRYQDLGQTTHIIFVCQGGDRSAAAAEFMASLGAHEIYNAVEGMSSWTGPRERTRIEDQ
ncbi:MAG: rhodanese-like domain-containing protein [Myxococcota bacterium]|nr:rhodanese-like domain-containing protein [Myxococcota bacterium]